MQLGCTSFGGPIAHLGYFERSYVQRRRWLTADEYAGMVALCQTLPGPTSSQVGFLVGLHRAGWRGGLAAWVGFTLPSVVLMYAFYEFSPALRGAAMNGVLLALKWVTVFVVSHAVWRMAKSLCPDASRASIALLAAIVVSLMKAEVLSPTPSPSGALWGGALMGAVPLLVLAASAGAGYFFCQDVQLSESPRSLTIDSRVAWFAIAAGVGTFAALGVMAGASPHGLAALADIFYRTGALVFGGGHVVLPLLHDALVPAGWISDSDFLSSYGAAQVLPGPLFSIAAYLGAAAAPAGSALLGAGVAVLFLFLPGLLSAVAALAVWTHGARLPRARAALAGVNAGAVGILAAALFDPVLTGALAASGTLFK